MINRLNRQEKLLYTVVALALLSHFAAVFRQTYVKPLVARQFESSVTAPLESRSVTDEQASSAAFSELFGVKPQTVKAEPGQVVVVKTLADMQPKLLALDERAGKLTAYVAYESDNKQVFVSLVLGDTLLGYKVSAVNMAQISFESLAEDSPEQATVPKPSFSLRLFDSVAVKD